MRPTDIVETHLSLERVENGNPPLPEDRSWGGGDTRLYCGICNFVMERFVDPKTLNGTHLMCPRCLAENQIPRLYC